MTITVEYRDDKYVVDAPYEALEIMRGAPIRRYDKPSNRWILPPVSRIRDYLRGYGAQFIGGCEHAPEARRHRHAYDGRGHTFKTKPYAHQIDAVGVLADRTACGVFASPGTGKSKMLMDDLAYQATRGRVQAAVVVCPNSITGNWMDECDIHLPMRHDKHVWQAGGEKKLLKFTAEAGAFPILIVAVESLSTKSALGAVTAFIGKRPTMLIVDESSRIKNHEASRTKNLIALARKATMTRIATGTPATKGPHNLWSQFEFLDPQIIDMSYFPFRAFFCMMGGYKLKEVVGSKNQDILLEMVAPYTYQVTKDECLDLPEKVYQRREYELTPEWLKLYGEIATEAQIPLVRDLRLHQLLGGFVVVPEARQRLMDLVASPEALAAFLESDEITYATQPAPGPNPHLEALLEALDEIDGKVVIWCRYRAEIEIIAQALTGAVQFHGGVSMEDRNAARRAFQTDPNVRYFIGQISTGGIGITLTAASVEIFYSGDWSAENRIQAEDRIHRIGQEGEHCLYIDLVARGNWIDKRILNTVQDGKDYHAEVMCDLGHLTKGSR